MRAADKSAVSIVAPRAPAENGHLKGGMGRLSPALQAVALGSRALDRMAPELTTRLMLRHFTRPRIKPGSDYRASLPGGARRVSVWHASAELTGWHWGNSGPRVLLVHGWEDHSGSMLPFVKPLRALGYQVIAVDAPGHGLSARTGTHLLDCSEALGVVASQLGPFESIIAHSFGATAACLMLSRAEIEPPKCLTLLSPMRDMEQHLQVFADIAMLSPDRADRLRGCLTAMLGCTPESVSALNFLEALATPGLVFHDQLDPVIPYAVSESIAGCWRGSTLIPTRNLGHRRILRCPDVLSEVLRLHGWASAR